MCVASRRGLVCRDRRWCQPAAVVTCRQLVGVERPRRCIPGCSPPTRRCSVQRRRCSRGGGEAGTTHAASLVRGGAAPNALALPGLEGEGQALGRDRACPAHRFGPLGVLRVLREPRTPVGMAGAQCLPCPSISSHGPDEGHGRKIVTECPALEPGLASETQVNRALPEARPPPGACCREGPARAEQGRRPPSPGSTAPGPLAHVGRGRPRGPSW